MINEITPALHEKVYNAILAAYEFCNVKFMPRISNRGSMLEKGFFLPGNDLKLFYDANLNNFKYTNHIPIPLFRGMDWFNRIGMICLVIDISGEIFLNLSAGYDNETKQLFKDKIFPIFGDKLVNGRGGAAKFILGKFDENNIEAFENLVLEFVNSKEYKAMREIIKQKDKNYSNVQQGGEHLEEISNESFEYHMKNIEKYRRRLKVTQE